MLRQFFFLSLFLSFVTLGVAEDWVPGEKYVAFLVQEYRQRKWDHALEEVDEAYQKGLADTANNSVKRSAQNIEENSVLYEELKDLFNHTAKPFFDEVEFARSKRNAQYRLLREKGEEAFIHHLIARFLAKEKLLNDPFFSPDVVLSSHSFFLSFWEPLFAEKDEKKRETIGQLLAETRGKLAALRHPGEVAFVKQQQYQELTHILRIALFEKMLAVYSADIDTEMRNNVYQAYDVAYLKMAASWDYFTLKKIAAESTDTYDQQIAQLFVDCDQEVNELCKKHQSLLKQQCTTLLE